MEIAMAALDKIMRANELNFQLLSVLPVLFLTGLSLRWAYQKATGRSLSRRQREGMDQRVDLLLPDLCSNS